MFCAISAANCSAALLVPVVLILCACPHRVDFGAGGEPQSAEDLLRRVAVSESAIISVKGDAKLKVNSPSATASVTLFVAVTHPAYLHLEALDFFGKPQGVFVSDGTTFGLYDGQSARYLRGPATARNVARFVPIALAPAELAALLLGRVPRIPHQSAQLGFDPKEGTLVLTLKNGAAVQVLTIRPPSYRVIHSAITGIDAYDVTFANLEDLGGFTHPRRIFLSAEKAQVRIELNYQEVVLNEAPDLTLYQMTPPANVPIVEVD